jgi:hypothetical protein
MFNPKAFPIAIALTLGSTALATPLLLATAAQSLPVNSATLQSQAVSGVIAAGTLIPVTVGNPNKILIAPDESRSLTLTVATPIRDQYGNLVIPAGSQIAGQLQPAGNGVQFVARQVQIGKQWQSLNATSDVIVNTETVKQGATTADVLKGTAAGAGTATIIAGTTGDRHINALEVLGGAAVGALAGWALPTAGILGGGTQEMIAINPNRDLTLILRSDFRTNGGLGFSERSLLRPVAPNTRQPLPQPSLRNAARRVY